MEKTVRQLAADLSVAKSTIGKAISDLGIEPRKVGNRFLLSEQQVQAVTARVLHRPAVNESLEPLEIPSGELDESPRTLDETVREMPETVEQSHKSDGKAVETLIESLKAHISDLQAQLTVKDQQLSSMAAALQTAQEQQSTLTEALKVSQEQQAALTAALTAAQALHAGTIQERLTDHSGGSGDASAAVDEPVSDTPAKKRGFFARLFRKG